MSNKRFRVAFSFAGEKRDHVQKTAEILAKCFSQEKILYDKFHESEFARYDLGIYLPQLYSEQSDLIVPVICESHDPKLWTGWEWMHIYSILTKTDGYRVMPCRFDHANVEGLSLAAAFVELDNRSPYEFACLILERLALNEQRPRNYYLEILRAIKQDAPTSDTAADPPLLFHPPFEQQGTNVWPPNPQVLASSSNFFNTLVSISKSERDILKLEPDKNFLDQVAKFLDEAKNPCPLQIHGFVGSGKSWIVQCIYHACLSRFREGQSTMIPAWISVENPSKDCTTTCQDLSQWFKESGAKSVVVFLDNVDNQRTQSVETAENLILELNEIFGDHKKVIAVGLNRFPAASDTTNDNLVNLPTPEVTLMLVPVSRRDTKRLRSLVTHYVSATTIPIQQLTPDDLLALINRLEIELVDPFTLELLTRRSSWCAKHQNVQFCELVEAYLTSDLKVARAELSSMATSVFNFLTNNKNQDLLLSNPSLHSVITCHTSVRDYFVARHTIESLMSGLSDEALLTDTTLLNKVFTFEINQFAKQLLNKGSYSEQGIIHLAQKYLSKQPSGTLVHIVYLLGRVKHPARVKEAIVTLESFRTSDYGKQLYSSEDQFDLLLARSIEISLTYLGDVSASERHLDRVIHDKIWNNLNRGFHLEYYGDLLYAFDKDNLISKDQLNCDFPMTFSRLSGKIREALKDSNHYPLLELDIVTLCSLVLNRMAAGTLREVEGRHIVLFGLVSRAMSSPIVRRTESLNGFLMNCIRYLKLGNSFTPLTPVIELYSLKSHVRAGWKRFATETQETSMRIESVAEHSFACMLIAKLLLPEASDIPFLIRDKSVPADYFVGYDKGEVIRMLEVHDWGEWLEGDVATPDKKPWDEETERNEVLRISCLAGVPGCYPMPALWEEFSKFEQRSNICARLALEIDILENLLQLLLYWSRFPGDLQSSRTRFFFDLENKLVSPLGKQWREYLHREIKFRFPDSSPV